MFWFSFQDCFVRLAKRASICTYLGFRFGGISVVTVFEGQDTIARVNRCFGLLFTICFARLAERSVDL